MAQLDWALLCDHAYFDSSDRLCMLGVMRQLRTTGLPETMTRLVIVAKVTKLRVIEQFDVSVAILSPSGFLLAADHDSDAMTIDLIQDFVIVTIRGMPITESGSYTFRLQIEEQPTWDIDLPVVDLTTALPASVH